jgi:uncharacterized protein DUF4277
MWKYNIIISTCLLSKFFYLPLENPHSAVWLTAFAEFASVEPTARGRLGMLSEENYINERLDHLGIVAGVCQEIGLAGWLDAQDPDNRQQVSVGTATVAMILNGLGFSNRQLYLVPQFFANKPVEYLLGAGITAEMLNDDCLGRTLDWLYAHDLTKLFAGIASRARQIFGIKADQVHVDTTSFSVSGEYASAVPRAKGSGEAEESAVPEAALIAITYGYSRDHRDDLKQWMLALATTHDGDVPLFLQPLEGNNSDKVSRLSAISAIQRQLREADGEASVYVADNGVGSRAKHEAVEPSWSEMGKPGLRNLDLSPEPSCRKAVRPGSIPRMGPCTGFAERCRCRRALNGGSLCVHKPPTSAHSKPCSAR